MKNTGAVIAPVFVNPAADWTQAALDGFWRRTPKLKRPLAELRRQTQTRRTSPEN
jgi:hypothetical protein